MKMKIINGLPVLVDKRKQQPLKFSAEFSTELSAADILEVERLIRKHKRVGVIVSNLERALH